MRDMQHHQFFANIFNPLIDAAVRDIWTNFHIWRLNVTTPYEVLRATLYHFTILDPLTPNLESDGYAQLTARDTTKVASSTC